MKARHQEGRPDSGERSPGTSSEELRNAGAYNARPSWCCGCSEVRPWMRSRVTAKCCAPGAPGEAECPIVGDYITAGKCRSRPPVCLSHRSLPTGNVDAQRAERERNSLCAPYDGLTGGLCPRGSAYSDATLIQGACHVPQPLGLHLPARREGRRSHPVRGRSVVHGGARL